MKILFVTPLYPPDVGGPATYAKLLVEELPKRGHNITLIKYGDYAHLPSGIRHLALMAKICMLARSHDLIFAQDVFSVGFPSAVASKISRKPLLVRVPGDYAWEQSVQRFGVTDSIDYFQRKKYGVKVEIFRAIQRFVCDRASKIVTPSSYFKNIVSGWVKDKNKIKVIYNGIDLSDTTINAVREKTILSAGRLVPWKGFGELIEMMYGLPGWELIIAGDGPDRDRLERTVVASGLQGRVKIVGALPKLEMQKMLGRCGIFVLNTAFESFSFQVVEAMNAGIPVVATNIGSIPELITNGQEGILIEPNNKVQLISAVQAIESDSGFTSRITEHARLKAKRFSIEETLNDLQNLLQSTQVNI